MRTFTVYRKSPPPEYAEQGAANPPDEPQFEGAVFSDGTVAVRWLTEYRSTSVWSDLESLEKIHGHPEYDTEWKWHESPLAHSDLTLHKVYDALRGAGLSKQQADAAVTHMHNQGILFREASYAVSDARSTCGGQAGAHEGWCKGRLPFSFAPDTLALSAYRRERVLADWAWPQSLMPPGNPLHLCLVTGV